MSSLPYDFVTKVDKRNDYIILSDTDSMFIHVPTIFPKDGAEGVMHANKISKEINQSITHHLTSELLPKLGIDPKYCRTEFKTEFVMDSVLLLDVKKNYSYRILAKEGKIYEVPEIKYTGMAVKSDQSLWTREFARRMVEEVILNHATRTENPIAKIQALAAEMQQKIIKDVQDYEFHHIGVPKKWGTKYKDGAKEVWQVVAMKLYNTIVNDKVLFPMSSSLIVPIKISNPAQFETRIAAVKDNHPSYIGKTPLSNLKYLAIPYSYDKEQLKKIMDHYTITVDPAQVWDILCNSTIKKIHEIQRNNLNKS